MDLPININTGYPRYELEDPLDRLQTLLNENDIDIESLDIRDNEDSIMFKITGFRDNELKNITNYVDDNPKYRINSRQVKDLNDMFDKNLINSNPSYIFSTDIKTRNNIQTIRNGINNYVKNRDMFVTPPSKDTDTKIYELLKNN